MLLFIVWRVPIKLDFMYKVPTLQVRDLEIWYYFLNSGKSCNEDTVSLNSMIHRYIYLPCGLYICIFILLKTLSMHICTVEPLKLRWCHDFWTRVLWVKYLNFYVLSHDSQFAYFSGKHLRYDSYCKLFKLGFSVL